MTGLCPCRIEGERDPRTTAEILGPLPCLAAGDVDQPWWSSDRYYQFYSAIGKIISPRSILEIGVRLGYSLIAMLRGFPSVEKIVGIDNESGVAGSQGWAADNLRSAGFAGSLSLPVCDSSAAWPAEAAMAFDLVHVDGNHSYEGTGHSLLLAWTRLRPGGIAVVDDTGALAVRMAVESARRAIDRLKDDFYFRTHTGWWVGIKE